jgi:N-acyl homoserine lactone hydrolase
MGYLVAGPDHLTLIDTGCSPEVVTDPEHAWPRLARLYHARVGAEELVDAQVRAAGFALDDITDVVLTHLHMDHVGGLQLLGRPRVWLQRAEHRWGVAPDAYCSGGYFAGEYQLPGLDLHLLDGDAEVAPGVTCVLTAGHTPGHQSVVVEHRGGMACVVGDAAYNRTLLDRRSTPALAWDTDRYLASLGRLATMERLFGVRLLFSHDADQAAELPHGARPIL